MYLKELTIHGFKSFAKKGELEFSAPITAIVGPNGSGKSNVAEAFRFVLGEQSPSKMRGKKGEDLIWNGSESTSRANRASVSIVLNNEQKIFPVDFDELIVERVVNRDGSNEYFINGSRTRLRDVHELLAAANIGQSGHHIISQGEADRILSANPKERREMVEDALGLKVFQYKKQESEKKLAKTLENIAQVESLRREVKPHLNFLERQVKKIEKSLELKEELKETYAEYLKREDVYIKESTARIQEEKNEPEKRLTALEEELARARQQLHDAEKDEKRGALAVLEEDISNVRTERQQATHKSGQVEGQIAFLERRIEERKSEQDDKEASAIPYTKVEAAVGRIESSVDEALQSTDVSILHRALKNVRTALTELLQGGAEAQSPRVEREEEELHALLKEQRSLDEVLAGITAREEKLQEEYEKLRASIEAEHSAGREAEREVFRIMNELRELESTLQRLEEEERVLRRDNEEFQREVREAVVLIGSNASAYTKYELASEDVLKEERTRQQERRRELEKMKIRLEELGGGEFDEIMKEYTDVKARDEFLMREIEDLEESVKKLEGLIADLTAQLNEQFAAGIEKIDTEFNRFFMLMFGGGEAKLLRVKPKVKRKRDEELDSVGEATAVFDSSLDASEEEASEGIDIDVKLPNKRVRGLDMLSGGERALTSIALIFAMSQVNPPPFVILDETDAALDEANSRRYGDMIESLAKRSQLILITHNRETMSRAGVLYGVTMGSGGVSKLLSVKFDEAVAVAK